MDIRDTFKLKSPLKHRDLVLLEQALFQQPGKLLIAARNSNRAADVYVRAAVEAGWVVEPACEVGKFGDEIRVFIAGENLDDMQPWAVRWMGTEIARVYDEVTDIPKN